jgi:predicted nucleic acid-binding protein
MKTLLDTNVIIHREASKIVKQEIGQLFNWIDKLKYAKCIHPVTIEELNRNLDQRTVATMNIKIQSYNLIKNPAVLGPAIQAASKKVDVAPNDFNDTKILNEVLEGRVDLLISEDKKIHLKASMLGITRQVFKIQEFLEKVISENPELVNYKVLAVKKVDFAEVDINDAFFDSFRDDYAEFNKWFNKKADEPCYVCYSDNSLTAFLYVKVEGDDENYSEISPAFSKKKRLKIGTLKVTGNGYKIGERFLKTIFDNALQYRVDEIYVTIFNKRLEQEQLIEMLAEWGFLPHGTKSTPNGEEGVYVRTFGKSLPVNIANPKLTFPFFSRTTDKYIIKIEPQYHTELFPDSINTKEDKSKYTENEPHRNRIAKVYISHSQDRHLKSGDLVLIYRMGETTPKKYSSTITTICIVESVVNNIQSFNAFYEACNRRTVIKKDDLKNKWWERFPRNRPFVINFLYAHSLPTPKPTLDDLNKLGIIPDIMNMPRGFIKITDDQFDTLINFAFRKPK